MKHKILIILIGIFLSSCYNELDQPSQDDFEPTVSKEELINILTDLQLVQAAMKYKENSGQEIGNLNLEYHQKIFDKYGVSKEELQKNIDFYKLNIQEYDKIYEEVIENLSRMESEIKSKQ